MPTLNQLFFNKRFKKLRSPRLKSLDNNPQKKGVCIKVFVTNPKKPNSANRKVARVRLSNKQYITCSIPGEGHGLQKFSTVLVRGARVRDLPGVKYKAIRGVFDLGPVKGRLRGRSLYGTSLPK
uniref:Ribosomal protein S12, mitochondrial n=2 Tax=Pavlovaceae TaxID=418969 RepID=E9P695_DIALT|nr:ribosomal protein S12 [Diacronema lutheri]QHD45375.1 ribosomal protein S12 [Pavlova sp. NIVA-4/92]|mmetsp:Transcript_10556/g.33258  ORF Transcript_10556/g.33258 Transcript_10556/m.33258 type:complete len:124 (-) Transcript_10556:173-544(-)